MFIVPYFLKMRNAFLWTEHHKGRGTSYTLMIRRLVGGKQDKIVKRGKAWHCMENLSNLSVVRALMERHGFSFSKALGQNFLINPTVCPRMAELGGAAPGVGVIEIGAGFGVLTVELARRADKVICVEIDKRLLPVLKETLGDCPNVEVINADVMETDLAELISSKFQGLEVVVCANLPYYITSPILMNLLEQQLPVKSITVMVQKEAAVRLCAPPGTREVGAVSLAVRYYSVPKVLFQVSRGSFMPAPDVDSTVIRLDVLEEPPVSGGTLKDFFRVVKAAFSMRRKTMVNCLAGGLCLSKERAREMLALAGIPENARAEQLKLEDFGALAKELSDMSETEAEVYDFPRQHHPGEIQPF